MATDVRVRLSAEGEAQVVNALRKVAGEGQRAGRSATRDFTAFNRTLSGTRTLLTQIAAVASVGVLVGIAKAGANAADQLGKMGQKIGASVQNLSALRLAAATADVSMETLTSSLSKFNKTATAAIAGAKEETKAFAALGISVKELAGLDAAERLGLVAEKFGQLEDSPEKSALALKIFGKAAAGLIPLLNDLSEGGLQGAIDRARELGVLLSEDTARAAQAINDDFTIIKEQVIAGAARFVEGLAPAVHAALTDVQDELGSNQDVWKTWGQAVGEAAVIGGLTVIATIDEIVTALRKLGNVAGAAAGILVNVFNPAGASKALADAQALGAVNKKLDDDLDKRQADRLARAERFGAAITKGVAGLPPAKAGAQDEDAPVVAEGKSFAEIEKERLEAIARLEKERAQLIDKQLDAEGRRHDVALRNIEEEAAKLDQVLGGLEAKGVPQPNRAAEVASFREALTRAEEFKQASEDAGRVFDEFSAERARVQDEISAGLLSELEGKERLLALDRERLPLLQAQAEALIAAANVTKDPAALAAAQEYADRVGALAVNVKAAGDLFTSLKVAAKDALQGAIVDTLTRGIREAQTFIEAIFGIGIAVLQVAQQILAQELATNLIGGLSKLFGVGAATGGQVQKKAEGGPVYGAGTATSDSIPALLSNGEFVVRAAVAQRPGVMDMLHGLNAGIEVPALSGFRGARRFADGGLVSAAGSSARSESTLMVGLEKGLVVSELHTPEGERAVIRILQRNPRGSRSAIGS